MTLVTSQRDLPVAAPVNGASNQWRTLAPSYRLQPSPHIYVVVASLPFFTLKHFSSLLRIVFSNLKPAFLQWLDPILVLVFDSSCSKLVLLPDSTNSKIVLKFCWKIVAFLTVRYSIS